MKEKELFYKNKSAWSGIKRNKVELFSEEFKAFIAKSKTERESVKNIIALLQKGGFKPIDEVKSLKVGQKVYKVIKHRSVLAAVIGRNPGTLRVIGSHIDSPRLDIKPNPIYEDSSIVLMKTHYYGGIKKYQWVNVPLSLHMVVYTSQGKKEICYGERDDEPKFVITDLLVHLSKDQLEKKAGESITGEHLNILIGNIPVDDEEIKEPFKFSILKLLKEKFGISESDFQSADIEMTPAQKPFDVGFDRSMVCAYGQDDRVSAYASLRAILELREPPKNTAIAYFSDKEEIGSTGDTGAQSRALETFVREISLLSGNNEDVNKIFERSYSISADVTACMDPSYPEVMDKRNSSLLGHGVSVEKYGGFGGKYMSNEASSEYMSWLVGLFNKNEVKWQTGELGKVDSGGGGTIAMYMAELGMDCIDVGPSVLSMHSTSEITSKIDVFNSYLAYSVFFNN